jgi:hypothetical protein
MVRTPDVEQFYVNKWFTVAACATLQLTAGLCYCFGIFSCQFKELFQWSQSELTGFGTALNLGAFSAFIPGALYNALSGLRSGPRYVQTKSDIHNNTGHSRGFPANAGTIRRRLFSAVQDLPRHCICAVFGGNVPHLGSCHPPVHAIISDAPCRRIHIL